MKRADMTVGMEVENVYGRKGTVVGFDGKKVMVRRTWRDGTPYTRTDSERAKDLYPVGTYEAERAAAIMTRAFAVYQITSDARIARIERDAIVEGKLLAFWGNDADEARNAGWDHRAMQFAKLHYRAMQKQKEELT